MSAVINMELPVGNGLRAVPNIAQRHKGNDT